MQSNLRPARQLLILGAIAAVPLLLGALGSAAATLPGCGAFKSQEDAQAYFMERGGSPAHRVGKLDGDRDGVACEGLWGPFQGYATIGYNKEKRFFYGTATMPPAGPGSSEYACMYGNRHFPDAARRLRLFKVKPGKDKPLVEARGQGAEAKPSSGRLLWRVDQRTIVPGRYYVEFEERVSQSPYGKNLCPGFRSRATPLP
ncbi:MAG: excalibur calcium-binding domain-containing protein [Solirubrobacterales bacterium]